MPQPKHEPENYSLEEMMERLKNSSSSKNAAETVIRPDGSEALKTKKRKRRSNQNAKTGDPSNKEQIFYLIVFVVITALSGLTIGAGILYSNSKGFRDTLITKLEAATGAKLRINQFRMNPLTANVNAMQLDWPEGNPMSKMVMNAISAKTSPKSIFSEVFKGDEVVVQQAQLFVKSPNSLSSRSKNDGEPSKVIFTNYFAHSLDLVFGDLPNPFGALTKSEITLQPSLNDKAATSIRFRGGALNVPNWPPLELDRSFMTLKNSEIFIHSLRFQVPLAREKKHLGNGVIEFSGSLKPTIENEVHQLNAQLDDFDLKSILGLDLGRHINGFVDTREVPNSNYLRVDPKEPSEAFIKLAITNSRDSRIELDGFPFLGVLKAAFDDDWYEFPNFDEDVSFEVTRNGTEIEIRDIRLERRGRISIRGSLSVDEAGGLTGKWQIGIPQSRFSEITDKKLTAMFREVKSGYCWVEIEISGTQAQAADNFRAIYDETLPPSNDAKIEGSKPALDSFESLILGE